MIKYTKTVLKKIETIFSEISYKIRYEKGQFQSGYCVVENQRVAVINKFYDTEARINCLVEILQGMEIMSEELSEESQTLFQKVKELQVNQTELQLENKS